VAGVSSEQGDGLNVELNLVPFIDLLSSLVLFLLVTAVWLQVGSVPASVESSGQARFANSEQNRLIVHLSPRGFEIHWPQKHKTSLPSSVPKAAADFNFPRLETLLAEYSKNGDIPMAAVSSEDAVDYGIVIETIDSLKRSGFTTVALSTD
jgi:biopolymer transport protein ExbD